MQDAQKTAGAAGTGGELPGARSPVGTIALALLVLAGIVAAFIIFTRDSGAPEAPAAGEGRAFALSDEEAIDRYLELDALVTRAYRTLDLTLIPLIYTPDSSTGQLVSSEIRQLVRQDVRIEPSFQTLGLNVLAIGAQEIKLRHVVIADARFFNKKGVDITEPQRPSRQVVEITMKPVQNRWLIDKTVVTEATPVSGS